MMISLPQVKRNGELTGTEVTIKFTSIIMVGSLLDYRFNPTTHDDDEIVVPEACTIYLEGGEDVNVRANYNELKELIKQNVELYG